MIPKQAIEKAIEGGWTGCEAVNSAEYILYMIDVREIGDAHYSAIALDPTFWQALGKALGWVDHGKLPADMTFGQFEEQHWNTRAHRFYDLILTGGDIDNYWNEILK